MPQREALAKNRRQTNAPANRRRPLPSSPWILEFANLGHGPQNPAPPVFRAKQSRSLGRYDFDPKRPYQIESPRLPVNGRPQLVTQDGRRWFRYSETGALHPAPEFEPFSVETVADLVTRHHLNSETGIWQTTDFLWWAMDSRGKVAWSVECKPADLKKVAPEKLTTILGEVSSLQSSVRELLVWVLAHRDPDVTTETAPARPLTARLPKDLRELVLEGGAPRATVTEDGRIVFRGLAWPHAIHAALLNVLQDRSWWDRLRVCGWCGRFFLVAEGERRGRPSEYDTALCQKNFSTYAAKEQHL
jgi:hypothetical protein